MAWQVVLSWRWGGEGLAALRPRPCLATSIQHWHRPAALPSHPALPCLPWCHIPLCCRLLPPPLLPAGECAQLCEPQQELHLPPHPALPARHGIPGGWVGGWVALRVGAVEMGSGGWGWLLAAGVGGLAGRHLHLLPTSNLCSKTRSFLTAISPLIFSYSPKLPTLPAGPLRRAQRRQLWRGAVPQAHLHLGGRPRRAAARLAPPHALLPHPPADHQPAGGRAVPRGAPDGESLPGSPSSIHVLGRLACRWGLLPAGWLPTPSRWCTPHRSPIQSTHTLPHPYRPLLPPAGGRAPAPCHRAGRHRRPAGDCQRARGGGDGVHQRTGECLQDRENGRMQASKRDGKIKT